MDETLWTAVDDYVATHLATEDDVLRAALAAADAAGLPAIHVSPAQGRLLEIIVRMTRAKRVLEIGTLAGYSTIWMARALPDDGRLVTLELSPEYAAVARANLERAGHARIVDVREGAAADSLPALASEPPFDLVFIDADKRNTPLYFEWALRLTRPGAVIVVDNVVRGGALADAASDDADVRGMREFIERLGRERGAIGTVVQTVGSKGYDGFALVVRAS